MFFEDYINCYISDDFKNYIINFKRKKSPININIYENSSCYERVINDMILNIEFVNVSEMQDIPYKINLILYTYIASKNLKVSSTKKYCVAIDLTSDFIFKDLNELKINNLTHYFEYKFKELEWKLNYSFPKSHYHYFSEHKDNIRNITF